jgi:hypothetical protein
VTKEEKLSAVSRLTREAYKAAPADIQALCEEKVREEHQVKVISNVQGEKSMPTNKQYAMSVDSVQLFL